MEKNGRGGEGSGRSRVQVTFKVTEFVCIKFHTQFPDLLA